MSSKRLLKAVPQGEAGAYNDLDYTHSRLVNSDGSCGILSQIHDM